MLLYIFSIKMLLIYFQYLHLKVLVLINFKILEKPIKILKYNFIIFKLWWWGFINKWTIFSFSRKFRAHYFI